MANGNLHLYQQLPLVPHQLPEVAGGPGSNRGLFQAHQAVVELHQEVEVREGEEGVELGGRRRSFTVCVGLHMMRQSEY